MNANEIIYIVGVSDCECNETISLHKTYEGALESWNNKRKELIKKFKRMKLSEISRGHSHEHDNNWNKNIINLSCNDPTKIDNYPQDTPYIIKMKLEE